MTDAERKRLWAQANREKVREAGRRHYVANREKVKEQSRRWAQENRERSNEQKARWDQENLEKRNAAQRRRGKRDRDRVLDHYGRSCACCSTTELLTIDHIDGGGYAHRIELFGHPGGSATFYRWLITNGFPSGYQVLCRPCNASKADGVACRLDHVGS